MKKIYSIAMFSLLALAPAAFAVSEVDSKVDSKMDTVKKFGKAGLRVVAGTILGIAPIIADLALTSQAPDNYFLSGSNNKKKWANTGLVTTGIRQLGTSMVIQWLREKIANIADRRWSNENEILHGSRTVTFVAFIIGHLTNEARYGFKPTMEAAYREYKTVKQAQAAQQ